MAFDSGTANACPVRPSSCSLPIEILRSVIAHAEPRQMKDLALVCRDFHDTVSSILYRHIHHTFTEADDDDALMPVELLSAILQTLAGGHSNYAKYTKSFSITAESSSCAKKVADELKYDCSAGKLFNALLQAALKNASNLESFIWDIRIELSQSLLFALSQKPTLQHLHLRLQKGPSLHSRSIVNTFQASSPPNPPATSVHHHHPEYISPNQNLFGHPNPPGAYAAAHHTQQSNSSRLGRKLGTAKLADTPKNISRFSGLKTLAVLDIDDYEYIPEIAECVTNSVSSLQTLKLSLSRDLALKTRTKAVNDTNDAATSVNDDDDDFNPVLPHPPPQFMAVQNGSSGSSTQLPSSMAEVRKDRARQEEILPTILGLAKAKHDPSIDRIFEMAIVAAHERVQRAAGTSAVKNVAFTRIIGRVAHELLLSRKANPREKNALEKISKAVDMYIKEETHRRSAVEASRGLYQTPRIQKTVCQNDDTHSEVADVPGPSSSGKRAFFNDHFFDYLEQLCMLENRFGNSSKPPVFPFDWQDAKPTSTSSTPTTSSQETEVNNSGPSDPIAMDSPTLSPLNDGSHIDEPSTVVNPSASDDKDSLSDIVDMEHPDVVDDSDEDQQSVDEAEGWASKEEPAQVASAKGKTPQQFRESSSNKHGKGFAFLRSGHGIGLESLSLYLIPVRASVLFKGIDITRLKHLTLLNVGSQAAFWSTLSKLPDPVQLASIHTDHVTDVFLHALSSLESINELFLFEISRKTQVTPLTPPTTVSMEDIRQKVLKTHLGNLRRLVIRNENSSGWKFNVKSISTLSNRGARLEELMIEVDADGLHFLMQKITKFRSLSALHILLNIRDSNATLLREMRYNLADTICHCPSIPLQYIGLSNSNTRAGSSQITQLKRNRLALSFDRQETGYTKNVSVFGSEESKISDSSSTDGYDTDDEIERLSPLLKKDLKRSAVEGVKMWRSDIWRIRL